MDQGSTHTGSLRRPWRAPGQKGDYTFTTDRTASDRCAVARFTSSRLSQLVSLGTTDAGLLGVSQHPSLTGFYTGGCSSIQGTHCYLRCYGDSPAVFVGWLVVVDWNHSLIFALGQLITILSHQLQRHTDQRQITHSEPHFYTLGSTLKHSEIKMINVS